MQSWIKFYEAVTKPLPIASTLFLLVSTSFLLTASDSTLTKLGMVRLLSDYRWAVGLGFVIALAWLSVTIFLWVGKWVYREIKTRQAIHRVNQRVVKEIPQMTEIEKAIIGYLLAKNQRMFTNTPDGGHANTLISKGIVVLALRPGQTFSYWETPYEIPEHVWSVLLEHKEEFPNIFGEDEAHPWRIHWMER